MNHLEYFPELMIISLYARTWSLSGPDKNFIKTLAIRSPLGAFQFFADSGGCFTIIHIQQFLALYMCVLLPFLLDPCSFLLCISQFSHILHLLDIRWIIYLDIVSLQIL